MQMTFVIRKPNPDWDRHLRRAQKETQKPKTIFISVSKLLSTIKAAKAKNQPCRPLRSLITLFIR